MCLAIPGLILEITDDDPLTRTGRVGFGGVVKSVNLSFVPEAQPGEYVIVHVGFAIGRLDPEEADRTLRALQALDPEAFDALGARDSGR